MNARSNTAPVQAPPAIEAPGYLQLLVDTSLLLARERDVETIVQSALDAGKELCGAEYGAFLYSVHSSGELATHSHKLTGAYAEKPETFPLSSADEHLMEHFFGSGILRCADISADAHFGDGTPFAPLTTGPNPVRSYMVVPVHSASGELFGGFFFGHSEHSRFLPHAEQLLEAVAAQTSVCIDNAHLHDRLAKSAAADRRSSREKQDTERRLMQALDAAQLGTWTWNRSTDLLDLDDRSAEFFHLEPHVPVTRSELRENVVVSDDRALTTANLRQAMERGDFYQAEYRIRDTKGAETWLCSSGIPTYSADSREITGMVGTLQNITQRKTQEEALRQSEKLAATGRLAATIAHEINNPLEAVTNLIYLVKTDPDVPTEAQHLLETADQELARVAQIAQQTLGFYRDTTRPVDVDMNKLLENVVALFHRKLTYKKIECSLDLEPELRIFGLQGELRQVFSNLVVNAIDASLHGNILIRAKRCRVNDCDGISVLVCDQGSGIPAEVGARLFAPFFTTKASVGTGLGLWVTRGIVEKQGGTIHFRSSVGEKPGTVFRVFLPGDKIPQPPVPASVLLQ